MAPTSKKRFNGLTSAEKAVASMYCATGFNIRETARLLNRPSDFVRSIVNREAVDRQVQANMRRAIMKVGIDPAMVAERVAGIAMTNVTQVVDNSGDLLPIDEIPELARHAIKSVKKSMGKYGPSTTIELHNPDKALDTTMRWLNISPVEAQDTTINVGVAVNNVADCEINDRIEAIARGGRAELMGDPYAEEDHHDAEVFETEDEDEYADLLD